MKFGIPLCVFCAVSAQLLLPAPALPQTTPTERAAARQVVAEIDALQARIKPAELARRMAAGRDRGRDRLFQRVEELWTTSLRDLSDHIGRNPEVGFQEYHAVDTLTAVLKAHGFSVETGQAGLETAFVGSWDSPAGSDGPTLGVIVEYDALRSTHEAFHGCQHNGQGPVGFASAFAIVEYMKEESLPGRVRVYGTPAEEMGPPPKVAMWQAGVFEAADILVRSHGSDETNRNKAGFGVCCLNINEVRYIFTGRAAHQRSSWFGRNALSAAVQFYSAVDALRPTLRPEASIQGVIPEGGIAPNVVPDRVVVDYYLRYPDEVYLAHIDSMIANAARGAALATGTQVTIEHYGEYRDGITLGTLEELVFAYAEALNAPGINPEPQRPAGYEETGFVTRDIPGVGVSVFTSPAPGHSYARWQDSMKPVGHTGFLLDAKIMSAVLYHFLTDERFRETVKEEHRAMAAWLEQYLTGLRETYGDEIGH
ncbi:MAG: peptidase dimerization domain-containing protein [Gemmatimonadales bacterium]|nr:peptidase dimerization domain-containing protein [Gemmatimonadales bacterium]NIN11865.1 peptidase dimerization domain-containing protein [Gemmatimonadales bacterium]NIN50415.1 peptidase dimerization domain-containing protein [Gemmatimonadales bacterium]NIP07879.1 peptidase dimerization domain-containing protein [Gemmatimonadales bacterium]NIR02083.1 peptidase dimerization domain-containing protein [Gemmatimonadales bacterium]